MIPQGTSTAKLPGAHAEVTAMEQAQQSGARMRGMRTSRDICEDCADAIESAGGQVTSPRTAVWPDNPDD